VTEKWGHFPYLLAEGSREKRLGVRSTLLTPFQIRIVEG